MELASLQCQSYLAATNALALVAKEHAWVAVVAANGEEDRVSSWFRLEQRSKERSR